MSNYVIDFSDPLQPGFTIPQGAYNGPGGNTASTTLRLYGAGARQWGESVNEDLVKLLENFMGASAPLNPIPGQLWIETFLYYLDTDTSTFYAFDYANTQWNTIAVTTATSQPAGTVGQYWYNSNDSKLHLYFQAYKQVAAAWHERAYTSGAGTPFTITPRQQALVYDSSVSAWVPVPVVDITTDTTSPVNNRLGTFRFDPVAKVLYVWNGTAWQSLASSGNAVFTANIDANNFKVINVADATAATDALNRQSGDARYLQLSGGTLTGAVTLSGAPTTSLQAATKQYVDDSVAAVSGGSFTFPLGGIIMWSPLAGAIPTGWRICDGSHGTPDLRGKFVLSSGSGYVAGDSGGSKDAIVPAHTHTVNIATDSQGVHTHTGSTNTIADHTHSYTQRTTTVNYTTGSTSSVVSGSTSSGTTGSSGSHNHTFTTAASIGHTHTVSGTTASTGVAVTNANMPPYVVMAYIMRTNS